MSWRLADAKNRFSEVVNRALRRETRRWFCGDATPWWWSPSAITKN